MNRANVRKDGNFLPVMGLTAIALPVDDLRVYCVKELRRIAGNILAAQGTDTLTPFQESIARREMRRLANIYRYELATQNTVYLMKEAAQ